MTPAEIRDQLETLLTPQGFRLYSFTAPDPNVMGGWYAEFRSTSLMVTASQDRTGDATSICVGSLERRAPGKQMRGPWSLSHLRGFFEKKSTHHLFDSVAGQLEWFREVLDRLLDSDMLNSDELNEWSIAASHALFAGNQENRRVTKP